MKKTTTLITLGLLTSTIILPSYASAITTSGQSQSSISDTSNRNITKDSVPPASDDVKGLINDSSNEDDTSNSVEKDKMLNQKSSLNEEKTDSLTKHTENKQSTSEKSSVYSENIENTDIVTSEDISISATSQTDTSSLPLSGNGVGYSIHISNNSKTGAIIPSGTIITFNIKSDSSINIDELLSGKNTSVVNSTGSPGLFSFISASSGVITVKTNAIIYPGTANFDMYFYNIKAQYGSEEGKIEVDLSGEINFTDTTGVKQYKNFSLTPDKVYIKISKNGGGPVTLPGFVGAGADEGALPILGISNSYLQSTLNGYSLFNSEYKYNDKMYMIFRSTFVKGYTGFSRGVLWSTVDKKEGPNDFKLLLNSNGAVTDITNSAGVNWTFTDNGAEADFSEWLSQNGWKISNGGNVTLYTIVPLNSISDTVQFTGSLGWDTYTKWSGTGKGMFANPSDGTRTPYFRGVGNQTIYNTDTLNPLEGINAYNGNTDISDKIKITDYDGYTVDGKNPPAGKYTLKYSVTSDSNEVAYYTRVITVLENKQSINGSDFSMHVGDKQPTVSDFKASATDKNGTPLDVMADFSKVDFKKIGTYDVVLNTIDGQSKTVKLTITENKQSINGSDFSMHVGDKQPTVSDFKASATDKNGTPLDVMADFSKVDFKKIGTYDVVLNTIDGQSKTVKITITENKQSINGSDFSMHVGDKQPTVSDFKASATDKNGTPLDVMADFSKVDFKKIGTYDVVLNTIDGQSKTVKLTITENKQSINGSDFSMHVGDKQPTVSDFKASATDKNGTPLDVMADFSKVDFKKIGTYDVVLNTIDGQSKTVKITIKNNKHTGIDHNNNKDKSNPSPGKNLLTNNSKATLPSTGEQKTNLFYVVGTMLILLPFAIYVGLKKLRRKN